MSSSVLLLYGVSGDDGADYDDKRAGGGGGRVSLPLMGWTGLVTRFKAVMFCFVSVRVATLDSLIASVHARAVRSYMHVLYDGRRLLGRVKESIIYISVWGCRRLCFLVRATKTRKKEAARVGEFRYMPIPLYMIDRLVG